MINETEQPGGNTAAPPVLAVSALNQAVARLLERSFPLIWVAGEISNFTRAASGHWYFTLKDSAAQVRAVMFKGRAQLAGFMPREGDKVEVRTLVTLYAPRGDYQLNVEAIRRAGVGNLYEAFLQLKAKLEAEGLFAPERKRAIPVFARCIVIIYPTPVQGEGAALKIAQAIATAAARAECDVLLVCRGGGSIEDLWSFNDETVARTIAASPMPVISGVGHETDFTIADFAADLRAPTPTAAAEMAAVARGDWLAAVEGGSGALRIALNRKLAEAAQTLDWLARRLPSPAATITHQRLKLHAMQARLGHATRIPLTKMTFALHQLHSRLNARLPDTRHARSLLDQHARRIAHHLERHTTHDRQSLNALAAQLELLNPQRTLERGYAIVIDNKGKILRDPAELKPRTDVTLRLAAGSAQIGIATVQAVLGE
jgi:exodeoxyribonuclease VII large subunit